MAADVCNRTLGHRAFRKSQKNHTRRLKKPSSIDAPHLRNAFRVRHSRTVSGSHLILVDDVFTTGSTVDECARVLKKAGAASVRVITVARG